MNANSSEVTTTPVRADVLHAPPNGYRTYERSGDRVRVDGKFFRIGTEKLWIKGVTYGPFAPNRAGIQLPEEPQIQRDFGQLRELGANTIRVYHAPPRTLLDLADQFGLKVFVDIPWSKHRCFLDNKEDAASGRRAVQDTVRAGKNHPAVLAYSVVNEIPADVARWFGPARIERFIQELVDVAKQEDPAGLATFTSFPPTEYLHPSTVDFYTFNVYLHSREKFRAYLQRLQNQTDEKPLLLGEYGIDSIRNGEEEQAQLVAMHLEEVFRAGLAGTCVFSYTDDWYTGGHQIDDWAFGLVSRDRTPKKAYYHVRETFRGDPLPPLERYPRVSVVVCSYNGDHTLESCLKSLAKLNYSDYEVILVDDGSTDSTREIAQRYPSVRYHYQRNKGLSVARNVGMDLATGEIIAYTDSDCMADEDWLYYLVSQLLQNGASAVGGPNLLPTNDGPVAACVSASPGTPAHILIDDEVAEHVPGCNMAFWADRLRAIGGFDPVYTKAGDDVDVCWRLQDQGEKIVFSPAGMVWHHRRSTVKAYLKQQRGYGEAEALLKRKHPDKFHGFRSESIWAGRIYTRAGLGLSAGKPVIHYGQFAGGMFQTIYSPRRVWWPLVCLSLEWWFCIFVLLGMALVFHPTTIVVPDRIRTAEQLWEAWDQTFSATVASQLSNPLFLLPLLMLVCTVIVSYLAARQARPAEHQRRWWSRLLIAAMHIAQPVERGFARYQTRFQTIRIPEKLRVLRRLWERKAKRIISGRRMELWSENDVSREQLLERLLALAKKNRWNLHVDSGWAPHDLTFHGDRWCKIKLTTVTENHGGNKRLTRVRLQLQATLFYNALMFFLLYILLLGWFADHRWELALIPIFVVIAWRLRSLRRQLNRTVMASILSVAEELGMTVVGASTLLQKPAAKPAEAPAAPRLDPVPVGDDADSAHPPETIVATPAAAVSVAPVAPSPAMPAQV